jgi:hypothetical protein
MLQEVWISNLLRPQQNTKVIPAILIYEEEEEEH